MGPTIRLSVIIVNYNVKYFLEQALFAAKLAAEGLAVEIWVVDNNSSDGSVEMVKEKFPEVHLIINADNPGFSIANNQAIRQAKGEHILLLNPDTLVQEDTFRVCLEFMDQHPQAGALGVKMLDGAGQFLPESKRGFPTPFVAFYKSFALSKLFPRSRRFNHYHLGYLSEDENHEVEVLAGAFMWMRKEALDKVGLLDESFFMYGEDIDLSYRIVKGGYKNYYLADTKIIHYKGESTKKGSLNYVRVFYNAMIIFAKKHFQGEKARFFVLMLKVAIYFRAFLSLGSNLLKKALMPLIDLILIFGGLFLLKDFWGVYHFDAPNYFGRDFLLYNAPLYSIIWLISLYFNGAYDREVNASRIIRGVLTGTIIIAAVYGFLSLEYRSSRMLILLGTFWSLISLNMVRWLGGLLGFSAFSFTDAKPERLIIIGDLKEASRVRQLLGKVRVQKNFIGVVAPTEVKEKKAFLGAIDQLTPIQQVYEVNEIIFCLKNLSPKQVIHYMEYFGPQMTYKTVPPNSDSIIGSSSKNTSGVLYTLDIQYKIKDPLAQRSKRVFDFLSALFLVTTLPLHLMLIPRRWEFVRNCVKVLLGQYTWVSYFTGVEKQNLPSLKTGVLGPNIIPTITPEKPVKRQLNHFYARDYHWRRDLLLFWKGYFFLGQTSI